MKIRQAFFFFFKEVRGKPGKGWVADMAKRGRLGESAWGVKGAATRGFPSPLGRFLSRSPPKEWLMVNLMVYSGTQHVKKKLFIEKGFPF